MTKEADSSAGEQHSAAQGTEGGEGTADKHAITLPPAMPRRSARNFFGQVKSRPASIAEPQNSWLDFCLSMPASAKDWPTVSGFSPGFDAKYSPQAC